MCFCPQPVLKSLFWLESQANFIILRTLSLLLKRCICSVLAHYLHTFSLFVLGPSEGNSHLLLLLCSLLPGPPLLFWSLQMGLDQSLISAVVPWSHEAHDTHTSITEMPFTQKFTHGAVKLIPKSWEKPYRNLFLIVKSPARPVIMHICIAKMGHMWGEMKNGGVM